MLCLAAALALASPPPTLPGNAAAVSALLERKIPGASQQFALEVAPGVCGPVPSLCFRLADTKGGRISVVGSTASELSAGVGHYLREYCNMSMGWERSGGSRFFAPPSAGGWPQVGPAAVVVERLGTWSFAENVCTASYTLVWHDWAQWEVFLDWAALWGINLLPALTGQEEVQYKVFESLGLGDAAIRGWFNGPALLTWSRGQNSHGSGVLGPLPRSWMAQQWQLQRESILPRMRALGISGMLPAFQGNVPWALASVLQKEGSNITQGRGQGNGTGWLDSRDPSFGKIADKWMQTLLADFGSDNGHVYQMDGLFAPTGWGAEAAPAAAEGLESGSPPLPGVALTPPSSPLPACEYGPKQMNTFIRGYASDAGKVTTGSMRPSRLAAAIVHAAGSPHTTATSRTGPASRFRLGRALKSVANRRARATCRRRRQCRKAHRRRTATSSQTRRIAGITTCRRRRRRRRRDRRRRRCHQRAPLARGAFGQGTTSRVLRGRASEA